MSTTRNQAKAAEMATDSTPWAAVRSGRSLRVTTAVGAAVLASVLAVVAFDVVMNDKGGLTPQAMEHLDESGVENPVTAVLLNFRSVDTWLEVGVLVLAVMSVFALHRKNSLTSSPPVQRGGYVLSRMTGAFVPLLVLGAGYLLWRGTHAPGGAFQAGALFAAAGVIVRLSGRNALQYIQGWLLRGVIILAFACMAGIGILFMTAGRNFLEYPAAHAGTWIFLLELVATISIGAGLWALFIGTHPMPLGRPPSRTANGTDT